MYLPFSEQDWQDTPESVRGYISQKLGQELSLKQEVTQRIRSQYWPDSDFVGPHEKAGYPVCIHEEQWLWKFRDLIRGTVLDMSTPRYWHEFIYDLPNVDKVLISNLDSDAIEKWGQVSRVDVVGDFCAIPPPMPSESVDTVLCLSILEHCTNPSAMVSNLASILKPGGCLLCACPFAYIDGHMYPDYWRFGRDGYILMCQNSGLEVLGTGQFGDLGKYAVLEIGENCFANNWHRGIPMGNWVIAKKPNRSMVI